VYDVRVQNLDVNPKGGYMIEYKGYGIVPSITGFPTGGCTALFSIYNLRDTTVPIHRSPASWSRHFEYQAQGLKAAENAARALIDAGGPFTTKSD
jgi:hypothetical protein